MKIRVSIDCAARFASFLVVLLAQGLLRADDSRPAQASERIVSLIEVILENHFDPPTRQQMVLAGVKELYRQADEEAGKPLSPDSERRWLPPKGLSKQISALVEREDLTSYLEKLISEYSEIEIAESRLTQALVESLPGHGRLLDRENKRVEEQLRANRYVGIGIALSLDKNSKLPQITTVFYKGPAHQAGISNGDSIVEINGESTQGKELAAVVDELRGEEGSDLQVTIRKPGKAADHVKNMTRGPVFIPTVTGHRTADDGRAVYILDDEPQIAYFKLESIGASTLHELRTLAQQWSVDGVRGLLLDLRAGSGTLHDTVLVADAFLEESIIGYAETADGLTTHRSHPGSLFSELPLVALVGPQTSGGHAYLAAALQDQHRAQLVGSPPQSTAYVHSILDLPNQDQHSLQLTTGILLRADKTPLLNDHWRAQAVDAPVQQVTQEQMAGETDQPRSSLQPDVAAAPGLTAQPYDAPLMKAKQLLERLGQIDETQHGQRSKPNTVQ